MGGPDSGDTGAPCQAHWAAKKSAPCRIHESDAPGPSAVDVPKRLGHAAIPAAHAVSEAADYLRVLKPTVERLIKRKQIPSVKIGRSRRIVRAKLDDFIERNQQGGTRRST